MKNQPKKTFTADYGLFAITVSIKKGKPIEQLMNDREKQLTGLARLTTEELANLNEWLDPENSFASDAFSKRTEPPRSTKPLEAERISL